PPFRKAGRYFFFKNDGLQNQSVLYKQASLAANPETLLDPNLLSEDGTVALSSLAVSDDGRLLAYGTAASGSDWEEFRVRDVATGQDRPDHLNVDQVLGSLLDQRRRRVLLQPLPRAHRKGADRCQPVPKALLPPVGNRPGRGRARLRTAGPTRL